MTIVEIISAIGAFTGIGALYTSFAAAKSATATATKTIEEVYGSIVNALRERVDELEKQIKSMSDHACNNYDCEFRNKKRP